MTPEFKAKWVEALRSGDYKQARNVLRGPKGGFCCLGVAADLIDPSAWSVSLDPDYGIGYGWRGDSTIYVAEVADAVGISDETARELARRNDGSAQYKKHSFAQIADIIEQLPCA